MLRLQIIKFSHSRVPRIQKVFLSTNHGGRQYFWVFHCPSTLKSISQPLCINVKEKKIVFKDAQRHLNFLLNKQYINHIDDYITSQIDDPIDIAPFRDLRQASLKENNLLLMLKLFLHLVYNSWSVSFLSISHIFL